MWYTLRACARYEDGSTGDPLVELDAKPDDSAGAVYQFGPAIVDAVERLRLGEGNREDGVLVVGLAVDVS